MSKQTRMKQVNWDGKELLLVEVPEGFWAFHINNRGDIEAYPEDGGGGTKPIAWHFYKHDMPDGDWQFAFADPIHPAEQEAEKWVFQSKIRKFKDYTHVDKEGLDEFGLFNALLEMSKKTATDSLHSRIRSEGFQHPERVVVLSKKK